MYIAVIGHPGSGKTTLFQALSGIKGDGGYSDKTNLATIDVPDERLGILTKIFNPKKTVHARIELADTVAIEEGNVKNSTISAKTLQQMRLSDAFILTLRYFDGATPASAENDLHAILSEFVLSDMVQIETRLERIRKQGGKKDSAAVAQEEALLNQCLAQLNDGKPLSALSIAQQDEKLLRGFQFLSLKPLMVVVNSSEDNIAESKIQAENLDNKFPGYPVISACAKLESELALMAEDERVAFMEEYAITESIRGRIISLALRTMGLICFLTVGEDECRAWPIKKGMNAQEAAGTIHTDLSNKFIRAETVSYADFMKYGSMAECKKAGIWRLEGKTYIVEDGDILNIRAGN
ncbi:MAG: redox-regulated ATPase YchF [Syntrophus sp. (in: bacteria)]|nr:redox-regulated ATPase YchF [Syntrophus sp. (in: bacteria)]